MWVKLARPLYVDGRLLAAGTHEFADGWYLADPEKKDDTRDKAYQLPKGSKIVDGPDAPEAPVPVKGVLLSSLNQGTEIDPATGKPKSTVQLEQEAALKKKAEEEAAEAAKSGGKK